MSSWDVTRRRHRPLLRVAARNTTSPPPPFALLPLCASSCMRHDTALSHLVVCPLSHLVLGCDSHSARRRAFLCLVPGYDTTSRHSRFAPRHVRDTSSSSPPAPYPWTCHAARAPSSPRSARYCNRILSFSIICVTSIPRVVSGGTGAGTKSSGLNRSSTTATPQSLYIAFASNPRKTDSNGQRYIDTDSVTPAKENISRKDVIKY